MSKQKPTAEAPMISVSGPSPESVKAVREAIVRILEARADQETIRTALATLSASLSAPISITNCNFTR